MCPSCISTGWGKSSVGLLTSVDCARLNILPREYVDSHLCHSCVRALRYICLARAISAKQGHVMCRSATEGA